MKCRVDTRAPFAENSAPRPTKMGTIASPWRYDGVIQRAPQSAYLRRPPILHYASIGAGRSSPGDQRMDLEERTDPARPPDHAAVWTSRSTSRPTSRMATTRPRNRDLPNSNSRRVAELRHEHREVAPRPKITPSPISRTSP